MANNQSENVKILFYNLTTFSINERDSICHIKFNLKEKLFLNNDFQHISSFHNFFVQNLFYSKHTEMKNILRANSMYTTLINIDTYPLVSLILKIFKMVQLKKISLKKIYVCACNTSVPLYKSIHGCAW